MTIEQINEIVKNHHTIRRHQMTLTGLVKLKCRVEIQKHVDHSISVTVNLPMIFPRMLLQRCMKPHGKVDVKELQYTVMEVVMGF